MVKLDKRGTPYRCDIEGVRNTMPSARPVDIEPETWKIIGPYGDRLNKKADAAGKVDVQPQTAPVEGTIFKTEVVPGQKDLPNAGGASSSSAAGSTISAMPAKDHPKACVCEY